jgi:methionyl aminopeptidase
VGAPKANDPCWCGSGQKFKRCHKGAFEPVRAGRLSPTRAVPAEIGRPPYAETGDPPGDDEPTVKSSDVLDRMRRSCTLAADVLVAVGQAVRPGVTTDELDALCHAETVAAGAYPSPLNYHGYPKSLCTSLNEVVCHGIPDDRRLADGDIVNLDVTVYREGVHGDTNATFMVGQVDDESRRLVRVTRQCLALAIDAVRPGLPVNVIGRAISAHADEHGFGVVREFVGHGIGEQFHTGFQVPHHYLPGLQTMLEPGMVFTIEPMITMGGWRTRMWSDGWTAVTMDGRRTAQFEHTVLVTDDGCEILTVPSDESRRRLHPYWTS